MEENKLKTIESELEAPADFTSPDVLYRDLVMLPFSCSSASRWVRATRNSSVALLMLSLMRWAPVSVEIGRAHV